MAFSYTNQNPPMPFYTNSGAQQPDMYDVSWESFTHDVLQDQIEQLYYGLDTSTNFYGEPVLGSAVQSPVAMESTYSSPSTGSFGASYARSESTSSESYSTLPQDFEDPSTSGRQHVEIVTDNREKRRKLQNRNSQRAYRARTREKEEKHNEIIAQLRLEIEMLTSRERCNLEQVEALKMEIARLRGEKYKPHS